MFDGRHCTKEDLNLLIKETNRVKLSLAQKDEEVDRFIKRYLELVNRFDQDIADKMRAEIKIASNDYGKIIKIIEKHFEVLEQNIIVDIYEHR